MLTLSDLNEHVRRVVALNFPQPVWIAAEIAQLGESRGHFYLTLVQKEENSRDVRAQAEAALWAGEFRNLYKKLGQTLHQVLREGLSVKMQVRPEFHERYGFKLHIVDIDPAYTLGQLDLQRRQTIEILRREGLFDLNRELLLPPVLQRIALVSSETAAGRQDFMRQLEDNRFGYAFEVTSFHAAVQGSAAGPEVSRALEIISSNSDRFDCAVIVRGGGSRMDLSAFDEPELCSTAARTPVPVLAGIGHDVDETVLDLVAHHSLKTPTAVAEFIVQHNMLFETGIIELTESVRQLTSAKIREEQLLLEQVLSAARWSARQLSRNAMARLDLSESRIPVLAGYFLKKQRLALDQADHYCQTLNPDNMLRRGFSITTSNGNIVTDPAMLSPGDQLETRVKSGVIRSRVE